jgi:N-acetylglucosamine kinase-like BadF-type ATPase
MSRTALLGIDGGGSSTRAWLADGNGNVLGRGDAGPSNPRSVGFEAAFSALTLAIDLAFDAAGTARRPVDVACLGIAGADRSDEKDRLTEWATSVSLARRIVLVNDAELVLDAGTADGFGIAVIAGTGSIALGRAPDGCTARAGGWGYLFGDEGGAYAVALAGLRLAARRWDGRDALKVGSGPSVHPALSDLAADPLIARITSALGVSSPTEWVPAIYTNPVDRTRIAALAPVIVSIAREDPSLFETVLKPAALELAECVLAVARALSWTAGPLPLAIGGSFLVATAPIRESLIAGVEARSDWRILSTIVRDPVVGAIRRAGRVLWG